MLPYLAAWLSVWAADPLGGAWWDAAKTSFVILALVTVVVGSVTGIVTWPPERKRMDRQHERDEETIKEREGQIRDLVAALREANSVNVRAMPTVGRVAELVETRVVQAPQTSEIADALTHLTGVVSKLEKKVNP